MSNIFASIMDLLHGIENYHDSHTVQHEYRTGKLMAILAREINYSAYEYEDLGRVGSIHDIGKVALSSYILEKPGTLSAFERKTIELHPQIGYELVKKLKHPLCELTCIVTLTHHESFDGSGYPKGLVGKKIPIEGRICRICDVYDALRSYRPYRDKPNDHHSVIKTMTEQSEDSMAKCFDPELLEVFCEIYHKYKNIYDN